MTTMRPTRTPFIILPVWVLRHVEMTPTILVVYLALAERSLIDRKPPKGVGWVMAASGLGRSAVYGALATLREMGALVDDSDETVALPVDDPSAHADSSSATVDYSSAHMDESSAHADRASTTEPRETHRTSDVPSADVTSSDAEALRLAELLADLIEQNGSTRPTVTKAWVTEFDRMIRLDQRSPDLIEKCVRWCQADSFWRANIMSPGKLRKHYDRLRLASINEKRSKNGRAPLDPVGELRTLKFDAEGALVQ